LHAQPEQACVIRGLDSLQERTILWDRLGYQIPVIAEVGAMQRRGPSPYQFGYLLLTWKLILMSSSHERGKAELANALQ